MDKQRIEAIVLGAIDLTNQSREEHDRIPISADLSLFGDAGVLDSMGLVALLIDIEDALQEEGHMVSLSDERAMSCTRSPFRSVSSLVGYISGLICEGA